MNIKKLNEYKKASGLTNAKIAEITGITLSNIDKITSGNNTNPKLDTIQAICKAIGCTVDDLDDIQLNSQYDNSIFIKKLETLMRKKGIKNRSQLSKQSGIPYTTIVGFFEKGTENIRRTTLIKLSDFFGCSLEYLVSDEIDDENYGKNDNFKMDSNEMQHIQKYRNLDEYGKKAIDSLLNIEYERCAEHQKSTRKFTIAARDGNTKAGTEIEINESEYKLIQSFDSEDKNM